MAASETSVLYLSPYFWPEDIGSAPYSVDLARHLSSAGYAVSALTFRPHYPSAEPFAEWSKGARDHEALDDIRIERVPVSPRGSGGFKDRIRNDLRFLSRALGRAIQGSYRQTDLIIAYVPSILTLYGAAALKLRSGARIVAVVHDIESGLAESLGLSAHPLIFRTMRFAERLGLNFADEVIVLTQGMKTELERIGCTKPVTVLPIWSKVAAQVPIDPTGPPRVMYSGNFGKKQNLDQLLPLLAHLSDTTPEVEIILQGNGSERARFEDEIRHRRIESARFLDLAPAKQFIQSLQSANVHLVPQALNVANYALPSKLFSIMSAGRPFVCIAEPGSPLDQLAQSSGAGLCVHPGDESGLCQTVSDLLADPVRQQQMGDAGRLFVQQNMNRDTILEAYRSVFQRVFSARPQG